MPISLDFEVDDQALEVWKQEEPFAKRGVDLYLYSFEAPVKLLVDGVDLAGEWELPLLSMGPLGLGALLRLRETESTAILLSGGDIRFERKGRYVEISSGRTDAVARAEYDELLSAWRELAERIRLLLREAFPESQEHPDWGPWFRDGELPPHA